MNKYYEMDRQIEEIAEYCCHPCEFECDGGCDLGYESGECLIATETAKALYNAGYRRQDEVSNEIILEIEQAIMAHGTKYAMKRLAELKKKYEVKTE